MGLLSSMMGGAASHGMAMADKMGTEKRTNERADKLLTDRNIREDRLIAENNDREDKQIAQQRQFERERDSIQYARQQANALAKSKTANSPYKFITVKGDLGDTLWRTNADGTAEPVELSEANSNRPNINTALGNATIRNGKTMTQAEKEEQRLSSQQAKEEQKENRISERVNTLVPPSLFSNEEVQEVERLTRKQESGEHLSFEESSQLLRYEEFAKKRASALAQKQEALERQSLGGKLPGHNSATTGFLNRALEANKPQ